MASMRKYFVILMILSIVDFNTYSFAQKKKKARDNPGKKILASLHPKPKMKPTPMGLGLLPGYKHKGATDFEGNNSGEIWKKGGLKITYEMGFNEGQAVKPEKKEEYLEYREKTVNGRTVRFAFTKESRFIASVLRDDYPNTPHAANFYTKVQKSEDAADMVTMVMTILQK